MIEFLLHQLPPYLGLLLSGGLICFFSFRYIAVKRDKAFKREAERLLDALDADRRKHAEKFSAHHDVERSGRDDGPAHHCTTSGQ